MNWFQLMTLLFPVIEEAVTAVAKAEGKTANQSFVDADVAQAVADHLTKGKPNAAALDFNAPQS
jgi:hypothetical protein